MGKNPTPQPSLPTPQEPGKLHLDYKMHPHFLPKLEGGAGGGSYSLKNTVYLNWALKDKQEVLKQRNREESLRHRDLPMQSHRRKRCLSGQSQA